MGDPSPVVDHVNVCERPGASLPGRVGNLSSSPTGQGVSYTPYLFPDGSRSPLHSLPLPRPFKESHALPTSSPTGQGVLWTPYLFPDRSRSPRHSLPFSDRTRSPRHFLLLPRPDKESPALPTSSPTEQGVVYISYLFPDRTRSPLHCPPFPDRTRSPRHSLPLPLLSKLTPPGLRGSKKRATRSL